MSPAPATDGRRGRFELGTVLLAGVLHVLVEALTSVPVSRAYNGAATLGFAAYGLLRMRVPEVRRAWGFRFDNLVAALRVQALPAFAGVALLLAIAALRGADAADGRGGVPELQLLVYLPWGIAQQFVLQNLLARNLAGRLPAPWATAAVAGTLFSLVHAPRWDLVGLTLPLGVLLTRLHRLRPNLWVTGIVHGLLGTVAFALALFS